jgi:hypothetical protein
MNTPLDSQKVEETSVIAIDIASIDGSILDNIWFKLCYYQEYYSANISEIALGLNLSRPVITEFLGNGRQRGSNEPKFSRGRILNLFAELTKAEKLSLKKGQKELNQSQTRRIELKKAGPDELLVAAGLITETMKTVSASPQLEPQLTFISFLYKDQPLDSNLYYQIIGAQIDRVKLKQFESSFKKLKDLDLLNNTSFKDSERLKYVREILDEPQKEISLQSNLDTNIWLDQKIKSAVWRNYQSAVNLTRRNSLLNTESTGLFNSVLNNELSKHERFDIDLMVVGVERTSLSIPWVNEVNLNELLSRILKIEKGCESKLRANSNKDSRDQFDDKLINNNLSLLYPVTKTVVSCKFYKEDNETIDFECVSTGTQLGTATSAIVQNMGFKHCISKMEVSLNWLGKDIKSLVNTIVIITDFSEKTVSGEWVSVDLMQSFLQALKVAGNKWFYLKCLNKLATNEYKLIIQKTARLKADFYKHRYNSDQIDIDNKASDIRKFQEVSDMAIENIVLIRDLLPEEVQDTFLNTSYRINILCQLYMLHDSNTKIDHNKCSKFLDEIENILDNKIDKKGNKVIIDNSFLAPAKISLCTEKLAYNLSFGIQYQNKICRESDIENAEKDFLKSSNLTTYFEDLDSTIDGYIDDYNGKDLNKDPGYDVYHSLGSYHSIVGRILFYRGDKHDIIEAFSRFLKAACYFQRIGLTIKVQRSLALAGRVKVRLGDKKMVRQCIDLSESILEKSKARLSLIEQQDFLLSIKSRVQLLQAEESFIGVIEEEPIILCLKALNGALRLGLSRHVMDILYTIYVLSKSLGHREINGDLMSVFPEIFLSEGKQLQNFTNNQTSPKVTSSEDEQLQDSVSYQTSSKVTNKEYRKLLQSSGNNQTIIKVANELYKNIKLLIKSTDRGQSTGWANITEGLQSFLIETWNEWYKSASKDEDGEHPFSINIKAGDFLKNYN